jgi:hypothetical protein
MSCGGSHFGFRIGIKNPNFLEYVQIIIPGQFGFNCPSGLRDEAFATAGHRLTLDPMGKCSNAFSSETTNMIKAKLYMNVHSMLIYVLRWQSSWISDRHKKQSFLEDLPMILPGQFGFNCLSGLCSNAFSETTNMIKAKLYMNVHWMVLCNLNVFCSDMKFKMAATAGLLALIIFVVSEEKAFEHFSIGFNVNLCIAVAAILDFRSAYKTHTL